MKESDPPPLWREVVGDTEPWRRGRIILLLLGLFCFIQQGLTFAGAVLLGNPERVLVFGVGVVFFWLQFYFVWIGMHWIRWIWGAWNLVVGFCLLIWAWRDGSGPGSLFAALTLIIGVYLCFSPSIYFFARRQRELVRWKESLLIAAVCLLTVISLGIGILGLAVYREERKREAFHFANEVAQKIYNEGDLNWILSRVTRHSLQTRGRGRLEYFLADTKRRLGAATRITPTSATLRFHFRLPMTLKSEAHVVLEVETEEVPVRFHAILWDTGTGWEVERMSWEYGVYPSASSKSP